MIAQIDGIFEFCELLIAQIRIETHSDARLPDRIDVVQGNISLSTQAANWLPVSMIAGRAVKGPRPSRRPSIGIEVIQERASPSGATTYLAVFADEPARSQFNLDQPFYAQLYSDKTEVFGRELSVTRFDPRQLGNSNFANALGLACRHAGREELAAFLLATISIKPAEAFGEFHIRNAAVAGRGVVLEGWIANLADRNIHLMLGDFRSCVLSSFLGRLARPDIHDYLRSDGSLTSVSNEHGFVAIAPVSEEAAAGELFFVEHVPAQNKTTLYGPVATHAIKDEETALNIATQTIGDIQSLSKEAIDRFYRPLLSLPKGDAQARKFHFGPAVAQQPLASIIIPFYGDAFFLNCVHHLQRVLDPTFELVLVVDDPRIWPQIYSGLNSRSSAISVPTTLLQNFRNYGYGRANNLGFLAASSDIIFLMNSDVMVMDGAPLAEAAEAIRSRAAKGEPELVVGFSLLYEDNTIQHVGMEFPRSPLVGGMHLADHPMKGLPFSLYRGERVRRVPAVTAALMGLSSNLFGQLGGFDTIYERGDFEDADLCLRAEQLGAEVELHVHPGLYHLERQSIPNMGHQDLRSMVTYMNCVEFNERWAKRLSEASSPQAPKRVLRIRPRKQIVGSA